MAAPSTRNIVPLLPVAAGGTSETPTPGGATVGGFGPLARTVVATGTVIAAGLAPTPTVAATRGGITAAGTAPAVSTTATPGGATTAGTGPTSRVPVTAAVPKYTATSDETVTLGSGEDLPHGFVMADGMLFAGMRTSPGKIIKWADPNDLATYSVLTFSADGQHNQADSIVYVASTGKLYTAHQAYVHGDTTFHVRISEIDPDALTSSDLIDRSIDPDFSPSTGVVGTDGVDLWYMSAENDTVNGSRVVKFDLPSGTFVDDIDLGAGFRRGHSMVYDSAADRFRIAGTNLTSTQTWAGWVEADLTASDCENVIANDFATDDSALLDDWHYIGIEDSGTGSIVRISADLATMETLNVSSLSAGVYSVYSDGVSIWAAVRGTPGLIVQIDPDTFTVIGTYTLQSGENEPNEILRDGNRLYGTCFLSPAKVFSLDLAPSPPGGVTAGGVAPTSRVPAIQGGAVVDGRPPIPTIPVSPGGALVGGRAPTEGGPSSETPTPGGAIISGNAPTATVPSSTGGATAAGTAPTARIPAVQGGATTAGTSPTPSVPAVQGGAGAGGTPPAPGTPTGSGGVGVSGNGATTSVPVSQGGATVGGRGPSEGGLVTETPTPGGAIVGGNGPVARTTVATGGATIGGRDAVPTVPLVQGGATVGGRAPTVPTFDTPTPGGATVGGRGPVGRTVTFTGGAAGGGTAPTPAATVTVGGASLAGNTITAVRALIAVGGLIAGGYAPGERGAIVAATLAVIDATNVDVAVADIASGADVSVQEQTGGPDVVIVSLVP